MVEKKIEESNSRKWPNFLVIGAGKCGTTSLDHYLKQHPEVYMSPVKEPNFFGFELLSEESFKSDPNELAYYRSSVTDIDSYLSLFNGVQTEKAVGEVSNTYLYHTTAHTQIKKHIPEVKLVAIFRQPAERLYSRYLHLARDSRLPSNDFSECLNKDSIWWERNDLIKEGFYYQNLSKFYEIFDPSQIKVFLYEDLKNDIDHLLKEIFEFIEVSTEFKPNTSIKYNSSGIIKSKLYNRIVGPNSWAMKAVRFLINDKLFAQLKNNQKAQRFINYLRDKNLERPKLDLEMKKKLTSIYEEDILKLSVLIDRDLSHWIQK